MFEEKNAESIILKRMLNKVPPDIDKREGSSIIYNALAPVALELAMAYSDLDRFLEYTFITEDTPKAYIDKRVNEIGLKRKEATKSIRKGLFYNEENKLMNISLNSRFSIDGVTFKTIEKINDGIYKLECEQLGVVGNIPIGKLIPIDYINGLSKAELSDIILEGTEVETNKDLYYRFIDIERNPITSGNINQYRQWALEVNGVGKCKVYPLWNGEGTVKVVIVDSSRRAPSKELIEKVYSHIDEVKPIGAKVTIVGAVEKVINITVKAIIDTDVNIVQVKQEFEKLVDKYLKGIAFENSYISVAKIGNILLNTSGILDYLDFKINNSNSNLILNDDEIPILGSISMEV